MEDRNVYRDISQRTDGDVYIGVVGPVRTGKSTFIKRFMDSLVLPNIRDENIYRRAVDELPQSSAGRTIMTTEPKFIPEESVEIDLGDNAAFRVRMIDCVGYLVPSALGQSEEDSPRMVKTPWSDEEIPFEEAAEIGTKKVITDHSTIGLVITADGSFGEIPREDYEDSERRVVEELQAINKPFILLLNSANPDGERAKALSEELSARYQVPVFECIRSAAQGMEKIREIQDMLSKISDCGHISEAKLDSLDLGTGSARISVSLKPELFYKVLSEQTGLEISDERDLMESMERLSEKQREYDKIAQAYEQVKETGYGIVMPTIDELSLDEPQIIKQSGKYGIRLKASAPSIHLMRVETQTEVTPIVGSEQQSEELVSYLLKEFEESPEKIWESNIFGKSVHELVNEGLHNKLSRMPSDARRKIGETIEKIINDGCNGLICIII